MKESTLVIIFIVIIVLLSVAYFIGRYDKDLGKYRIDKVQESDKIKFEVYYRTVDMGCEMPLHYWKFIKSFNTEEEAISYIEDKKKSNRETIYKK